MNATWFKRGALWGFCASWGLLVAGCGGSSESTGPESRSGPVGSRATVKKVRLVFVTNSNSDWWTAVEKGMQAASQKYDAQVELRRNDKETTGQIKILEEVQSLDDVQGVAVSIYEAGAPGIADALRELQKAGKTVIAIDSDISPENAGARSAYIGTNNVKAGEAAGRAANALRPDGGKVCAFVGTSSAANARERADGFFQGAGKKFAKLEVFDDGGDFAKASANVQTAITKYPDVGLLLGLWSYNATRIAQQVKAAPEVRKKVTVVTFDLDELAVNDLSAGDIDATVCQNPYEMGYQGVKLLKALIEKDAKTTKEVIGEDKVHDTGVRVIVPKAESPVMKNKEKGDNVITIDEMKTWLESKGLKSS